jgi:cellulose synthase/poly-beta-1,6-N-acetylglucosamine synthase-like glycosyltransferase
MIGFLSLLVLVYCSILLFYAFRFKAYLPLNLKERKPEASFSIIVPFRNEAINIQQLLDCFSQLNYPSALFEIILIDDHSDDESKSICEQWKSGNKQINIKLIDNQDLAKSPKKSAILTALEVVKHEYILTTDADCLVPENWLKYYDQHLQVQSSDLVAGPVKIIEDFRFWTKFQVLDVISLQVIGLGSFKTLTPLFCNAANLCYKTQSLLEIEAFDKHKNIISGDDVFNLEAFQTHGKTISALVHQSATVWTKAEKSFESLTQQRIRWASKAKFYSNKWLKGLGFVIFFTNLGLVLSLVYAFGLQRFQEFYWLWIFKLSIDFYVLYIGNKFFKSTLCLRDYIVMLLIYPFLSSYFGVLSIRGKFNWKGRNYKL